MRLARDRPPAIVKGDLVDDLPALAAMAPGDATLVIFHSAVLGYVSGDRRDRFTRLARELGAVWISNEAPAVIPEVAARLEVPPPANRFLLAVDGNPVALTGPHGQSIDWLR
jgi:hypothetical protein